MSAEVVNGGVVETSTQLVEVSNNSLEAKVYTNEELPFVDNNFILSSGSTTGILSGSAIPAWLDLAITDRLTSGTSSFADVIDDLSNLIRQIELGVNSSISSVRTDVLSQNAVIDTNKSELNTNIATSLDTALTAVDGVGARTSSLEVQQTVFDGNLATNLASIDTLATENLSRVSEINGLSATVNTLNGDLGGTADIIDIAFTEVGIDPLTGSITAGAGKIGTIEASIGDGFSTTSSVRNEITAADDAIQTGWSYGVKTTSGGVSYQSGFGLDTSTQVGDGSTAAPYSSNFMINATTFRFTSSTSPAGGHSVFVADADGVTFNGLVTFGNSQTGTIDEAIAASVTQVAVGDKNINITDNLIPVTSLVTDVNNAGYQFVDAPTKSSAAGVDVFAEPQIVLDLADEVYSPYVNEVAMSYYYRFGITGITDLSSFKIMTIHETALRIHVTSDADTKVTIFSGADVTLETAMLVGDLYVENAAVLYYYDGAAWVVYTYESNLASFAGRSIYSNDSGTVPAGVADDLWVPTTGADDATYVPGNIYVFTTVWVDDTAAQVTAYDASVVIKAPNAQGFVITDDYVMEGANVLAATNWYIVDGLVNPSGGDSTNFSGSIRLIDGTKIATVRNVAVPVGTTKLLLGWLSDATISRMKLAKITADTLTGSLATTDYVNTTTIDGGRIITNTIDANRFVGDTVWVNGSLRDTAFNNTPDYTTGFQLKANAAGTATDPNIYGAYIKGSTLDGSTLSFRDLQVVTDANQLTAAARIKPITLSGVDADYTIITGVYAYDATDVGVFKVAANTSDVVIGDSYIFRIGGPKGDNEWDIVTISIMLGTVVMYTGVIDVSASISLGPFSFNRYYLDPSDTTFGLYLDMQSSIIGFTASGDGGLTIKVVSTDGGGGTPIGFTLPGAQLVTVFNI